MAGKNGVVSITKPYAYDSLVQTTFSLLMYSLIHSHAGYGKNSSATYIPDFNIGAQPGGTIVGDLLDREKYAFFYI